MPSLRSLLAVLAALALAGPAAAQLAPNSPWQAYKWDMSNLYTGTGTTAVRPEILMLLDDTGSTSRLMFHPLFPQNWQDEAPPNSPSNAYCGDWSVIVKFSSYPTSSAPTPTGISVGFTQGGSSTGGSVSVSGTSYAIGGNRTTVTVSGVTYPVNTLIKPDGTEVNWNDVPATHPGAPYNAITSILVAPKNDPVNWLMCASHVRMQCTSGGVTRTIDFPLSWQMMDYPSALPANPWVPGATTGPLVKATAYDPVGLATYAMDTTNPGVQVNSSLAPSYVFMDGGFYTGTGYVRSRYIEWVFWGKDPNSPGGAYYCIPNAIPSATASVMNTITPNMYTPPYPLPTGYAYPAGYYYNGASDAWVVTGYSSSAAPAFSNNLPQRTRGQAIKECVIKTWLHYQNNVLLALRTFDDTGQTCSDAISSSSSTLNFGASNWIYMDPTQIATQVPALAANPWSNGDTTPLTGSTLSSLCQMTNPAAFAPLITEFGYTQSQLQCQQHFLLILTDGAPNESPSPSESATSNYPYYQTISPNANPAYTGNALVAATPGNLTGTYWNNPTLAGMAAHGGDGSLSTPTWIRNPLSEGLTGSLTSISTGSGWAPFWVTQRTVNGTAFTLTNAQAIQTMTVGVSLGVNYYTGSSGTTPLTSSTTPPPNLDTRQVPLQSDFTAAKFRLLASACFGDPTSTSYTIASAVPFYLNPGTTTKTPDASYFFDGRDPATLVSNLDAAFNQIILKAQTTTTATPVFPTLGAGLGNEVYLGMFLPPVTPGPIWSGDVLMFPTQPTSTGTVLTDVNGNPLTTGVSVANAQWSAANAIATRGWTNRVLYTRLPPTTATTGSAPTAWNPGLTRINLGSSGANTADPGYTALQPYLPGATATLKLSNWQFFAGADLGGSTSPLPTRAVYNSISGLTYLMGDVINSSPTVLQYSTMPSSVQTASTTLANAWNLYNPTTGTALATGSNGAFKVIFVGDNQGLFHAFGEVSWVNAKNVTQGVVDELWAFAPTEILPNIDQLQSSTNKHYYAVDGAPNLYLLDLPQTSTQSTGDGMFDVGAAFPERALVVFGLGKGGRSYYCINVADPGTPAMQWALCPNEQYNVPASRLLAGSATVITNMGLATPQPTFARIFTSQEGVTNQVVDTVLLGGGYSDPNIEAVLPATATTTLLSSMPAKSTLLGRGVVAVDIWTGQILGTWSTAGYSGAGPVTAAVIPLDLAPGDGIIQRAYFTDYYGSLWALGGTAMQPTPYTMFRVDTPVLANWNVRQVYTQPVAAGSAGNGLVTTYPTPFLLPYYPVTRTVAPLVSPSAVGVALATGDRFNPLDTYVYTPWSAPTQHRVDVVFDRQDINSVISAAGLANAGLTSFDATVGDSAFYLNNNYGYFINFAQPAGGFVPKGVNPPLVLNGNLFYSVFSPTNTSCNGGLGTTSTYQVCNIMAPIANSGNASSAAAVNGCRSGLALSWTGLASNLTSRSILTGVQAGLTSSSGTTDNPLATQQNLILQNLQTNTSDRFPKVRIWRVVH